MPQTGMDWWVIGGVLVAAIGAYIAWRQLRGRKAGVTQKMTNSRGSSQTAKRDGVDQDMDSSTDSDQNA